MLDDPINATPNASVVGQIQDPRLLQLYEYWLARKGTRRFPSRRDIDPLDIRFILGHVMLVDVVDKALRFRVRLHGTEMVERAGYELTGKFLDDLPITEYRRYVIERCKGLVASGEPTLIRHDRILDGRSRQYEALWLPFSEDGQNVTTLLCALIYGKI
jgi:hypothetical protein